MWSWTIDWLKRLSCWKYRVRLFWVKKDQNILLLDFYEVLQMNKVAGTWIWFISSVSIFTGITCFFFSDRCGLHSDPHFPLRRLLLQRHHLLGALLPLLLVLQRATVGPLQQHLEQSQLLRPRRQQLPQRHLQAHPGSRVLWVSQRAQRNA